jgi:hypothetical protein
MKREMRKMVKGKIKIPFITTATGGIGNRTRVRPPKTASDFYFIPNEEGFIGRTKKKPKKKKKYQKITKQQLRFRQCDCLYRLLRVIPDIILEWYKNEIPTEYQKKGLRSNFMRQCLRFNLEKLLSNYIGLRLWQFKKEEREETIIIRAKLSLKPTSIIKEDIYLPNPYRSVGR